MLKSGKIGTKLAAGFTLVLIIFSGAGWFAWHSLDAVISEEAAIEESYVPGIELSNEIEKIAQALMLNVRTYILGDSFSDLQAAQANFDAVREVLKRAAGHASKHSGLERLAEGAVKSEEQVDIYQKLLEDSQRLLANMATQRRQATEAGESMRKIAYDLLYDEKDELEKELETGASLGNLQYHQENIARMESLVESVHTVEYVTLTAIANKKMEMIDQAKKELDAISSLLAGIKMVTYQETLIKKIERAVRDVSEYDRALEDFRKAWVDLEKVGKARTAAGEAVLATAGEIMKFSVEGTLAIVGGVTSRSKEVSKMLFFSIFAAVAVGVVVAVVITKMITGPLKNAVALAERAGNGDLTIRREDFQYDASDEIGNLADSLAHMVVNQADAVREIVTAAGEITKGAETLAALSQETNASVEEVRSSLEQVSSISESNSAALEESNAMVEEVAAGAQAAAKASAEGGSAARHTVSMAREAVGRVEDVIQDVQSVGGASEENIRKIRALADSVENIARFVTVITSIADQTNLLALNAAIEAARAGDAGRGFAVVADEVRKLAEDSNRAAREVAALITTLDENARDSIEVTEESGKIMRSTVDKAADAQKRLAEVLADIGKITETISDIASLSKAQAASSEEMAGAIDQVSHAVIDVAQRVDSIRDASAETAGASEGVAREAAAMAAMAEKMQRLLAQFTLSQADDEEKSAELSSL